jgi:hypothetical protein
MITFESGYQTIGTLPDFTEEEIKNEPMIFSGDAEFCRKHGGPITKDFLARLPLAGYSKVIIDSRVHMLMPGWYPCIPGWHLDDIPRTRADGQPDHEHPAYKSFNIMSIIGDASVTEFIEGKLALKDIGFGEGAVYGKWNAEINRRLGSANCDISVRRVVPTNIISFRFGAFHRGVPAVKNGWRFFIRANYNTARKPMNEIRKQVQVYLPTPEVGW